MIYANELHWEEYINNKKLQKISNMSASRLISELLSASNQLTYQLEKLQKLVGNTSNVSQREDVQMNKEPVLEKKKKKKKRKPVLIPIEGETSLQREDVQMNKEPVLEKKKKKKQRKPVLIPLEGETSLQRENRSNVSQDTLYAEGPWCEDKVYLFDGRRQVHNTKMHKSRKRRCTSPQREDVQVNQETVLIPLEGEISPQRDPRSNVSQDTLYTEGPSYVETHYLCPELPAFEKHHVFLDPPASPQQEDVQVNQEPVLIPLEGEISPQRDPRPYVPQDTLYAEGPSYVEKHYLCLELPAFEKYIFLEPPASPQQEDVEMNQEPFVIPVEREITLEPPASPQQEDVQMNQESVFIPLEGEITLEPPASPQQEDVQMNQESVFIPLEGEIKLEPPASPQQEDVQMNQESVFIPLEGEIKLEPPASPQQEDVQMNQEPVVIPIEREITLEPPASPQQEDVQMNQEPGLVPLEEKKEEKEKCTYCQTDLDTTGLELSVTCGHSVHWKFHHKCVTKWLDKREKSKMRKGCKTRQAEPCGPKTKRARKSTD